MTWTGPLLLLALSAALPSAVPAREVPAGDIIVPCKAAPAETKLSCLSREQMAAIDAAARDAIDQTGAPAASIAVVRGGRIVYATAYGMQRPGQPARVDAPYPIASVSKQFTAAAILILADQGRLSLDDPVARFLPHLTRAGEVTVRDLLAHSSGYRDYWPQNYLFDAMTRPTTPAAILQRWAEAPLDFAPGTRFQYSNTGYVVAGRIVEQVSGRPLIDFLREQVFDRLGMNATGIDAGLGPAGPMGHGRFALGPVRRAVPMGTGWSLGAGDLVMTATDLARWDVSVLERSLMSPAAYQAQQREQVLRNGLGTGYGLGVYVDEAAGRRRIRHRGGQAGFQSENRIYPDDGIAVVVLTNADFGNAELAIADAIERQLLANGSGVERARSLYRMVRSGKLDRSVFTADANAYFSPQAIADHMASLRALGDPIGIVQTGSGLRGGFTSERFVFDFGSRKLEVTVRSEVDPPHRIEEFLVAPAS